MSTSGNTHDVLNLVQRWASAEQHNNAGILGELLAEDFVGVGPVGFVLTRSQWLGRFGGGLENRACAVEDPQVHLYPGAATVVGVQAQETSFQGRGNSGRFRVTLTAVQSAGRWLLAAVHIGPLQDRQASPPS